MTLAASVLPTPASPSMKSGFSSLSARKTTGGLHRLFYCPPREDPRQVLLVLRARPQVTRRVEPVGGVLGRLVRLGALLEGILDGRRPHRRRTHVGQPDTPPAVHLLGSGTDYRPIEEPAAELDVLVRTVCDRKHDLGDDLIRGER